MSWWTEFLAVYSYCLEYQSGKQMGHTDALSRCPIPQETQDPAPASMILLIEDLDLFLSATDIAGHSKEDPILSKILDWVCRGWPREKVSKEFLLYY